MHNTLPISSAGSLVPDGMVSQYTALCLIYAFVKKSGPIESKHCTNIRLFRREFYLFLTSIEFNIAVRHRHSKRPFYDLWDCGWAAKTELLMGLQESWRVVSRRPGRSADEAPGATIQGLTAASRKVNAATYYPPPPRVIKVLSSSRPNGASS